MHKVDYILRIHRVVLFLGYHRLRLALTSQKDSTISNDEDVSTEVQQVEEVAKKEPKILLDTIVILVFDMIAALASIFEDDKKVEFE